MKDGNEDEESLCRASNGKSYLTVQMSVSRAVSMSRVGSSVSDRFRPTIDEEDLPMTNFRGCDHLVET